jgi:DNA-binding transcriptional regulator YhcF (GntR family)
MYYISEDVMNLPLSANTKLLLVVLQHHAKKGVAKTCEMSVERLAKVIRVTRITANSCLQELQDKGFIRIVLDDLSKVKKYNYEVLV